MKNHSHRASILSQSAPGVGRVHLRVASRSRADRRRLPIRRPTGFRNCQPAKLSGGPEKARALCRPRFLLRAFLEIQSRFEVIAHGRSCHVRRPDTVDILKGARVPTTVGNQHLNGFQLNPQRRLRSVALAQPGLAATPHRVRRSALSPVSSCPRIAVQDAHNVDAIRQWQIERDVIAFGEVGSDPGRD